MLTPSNVAPNAPTRMPLMNVSNDSKPRDRMPKLPEVKAGETMRTPWVRSSASEMDDAPRSSMDWRVTVLMTLTCSRGGKPNREPVEISVGR